VRTNELTPPAELEDAIQRLAAIEKMLDRQ